MDHCRQCATPTLASRWLLLDRWCHPSQVHTHTARRTRQAKLWQGMSSWEINLRIRVRGVKSCNEANRWEEKKNPDDETLVDRAEGRKMSLTARRQHAAVRGFGSGLSGGRTTFLPQLAYRRSRALACKNRWGVFPSTGKRLTDDSPCRQLRPWDQSRGGSATRRAPWRARR